MRTYDLTHWWNDDDNKITIQMEAADLEVIVGALRHCARPSHRNVVREINHPMLSLFQLLEDFDELLAAEERIARTLRIA